jgi:hypothetical protein
MNWKSLRSVEGPRVGYENKEGTAFAFFPHSAEDGRTYWLERVRCVLFYGEMSERWLVKRWLGKAKV